MSDLSVICVKEKNGIVHLWKSHSQVKYLSPNLNNVVKSHPLWLEKLIYKVSKNPNNIRANIPPEPCNIHMSFSVGEIIEFSTVTWK